MLADEDKSMRTVQKQRTTRGWIGLYHSYYRRKGFYRFLYTKGLKASVILIVILTLLWFAEKHIVHTEDIFANFIENIEDWKVLVFYTLSEIGFGVIPPDFFIVWAEKFSRPFLMVTFLAVISYFASFVSYYMGTVLRRIDFVNKFVMDRFSRHFDKVRKWGGVLIIFTALFPLPFSFFNIITGMLGFPFNMFWKFALARIPRFYVYALILFKIF
jgi:hypothetical protein